MPASSALAGYQWRPLAGRSAADINAENADEVRQRRAADPSSRLIGGPAPDAAWDGFFGGMQRAEDTAHAAGKSFGVNWGGFGRPSSEEIAPMPGQSPSAVLAAKADPWDTGQLMYQRTRLQNDMGVDAYRDKLVHDLEADDPNMVRERAVEAAQAQNAGQDELQRGADNRAIDTFGRTEALRRNQNVEQVQHATEMLPFNPAYQAALLKENGILDTNNAHEAVANTNAGARLGAANVGAFARVASAPTNPADDATRVGAATQALAQRAGISGYQAPAAAGAPQPVDDPAAAKVFPQERLAEFAQSQNLSPEQARAIITRSGYTIR
jgi:hypothetical protein